MPSPLFADHSADRPPERETVEALITQARRLRGGLDAVRRESTVDTDLATDLSCAGSGPCAISRCTTSTTSAAISTS